MRPLKLWSICHQYIGGRLHIHRLISNKLIIYLTIIAIITMLWYLIGLISTCFLLLFYFTYYCYNLCDSLLYNPYNPEDSRVNIPTPKSYGLDYDNLFIHSIDGTRIHMHFIKQMDRNVSKNCMTLIYLHGNAGNIGHRLINAIELYNRLKCNVLLVEYRGYGLSSGRPSENGLYQDALAALQYLKNSKQINASKMVLFGRSLGAAVAIGCTYIIVNDHTLHYLKPMAMVIENTFTSVPEISRHLFSSNHHHHNHNNFDDYKYNLSTYLLRFLQLVPDWFYKSRYNSIDKISSIDIPTLFISGLSDELIPPKMMIKLFNKSPAVLKELHTFQSGTHNFTWKCSSYYQTIKNFLQKIDTLVDSYNVENNDNHKVADAYSIDFNDDDNADEKMPLILKNYNATNDGHDKCDHQHSSDDKI